METSSLVLSGTLLQVYVAPPGACKVGATESDEVHPENVDVNEN